VVQSRLSARVLAIGVIAVGVLLMHGLTQESSHGEHSDGHATSTSGDAAHPFGGCCLWVIVGVVSVGAVLALGIVRRRATGSRRSPVSPGAARLVFATVVSRAPPARRNLAMLGISRC
jgi:hypothetical protein